MTASIYDLIIVLLLIMFGIVGYKRGVIKEAVSLVGVILIFVIAYTFKEEIGNVLCKYLPFFTFTGSIKGLVSLNILIYQLIGFLVIFFVLFFVYQILMLISGLLQKLVDLIKIFETPSKIAGSIIGVIEAYLLIFIVSMVLIIPLKNEPIIKDSFLIELIVYKTPLVSQYTNDVVKTIDDAYLLADKLEEGKITINEANLEIIDTMIEYDIVSKKTVEQLQVLDKLKSVKGLNKVLNKY